MRLLSSAAESIKNNPHITRFTAPIPHTNIVLQYIQQLHASD